VVFVEFALLAVMSPALVPLPLDMVLLDIGAPGVRRTPGQKNEAGDISTSGVLWFFSVHGLASEGVSKSESIGGAC
jgi:hypothetical protein